VCKSEASGRGFDAARGPGKDDREEGEILRDQRLTDVHEAAVVAHARAGDDVVQVRDGHAAQS
jgi:hypothetical protein